MKKLLAYGAIAMVCLLLAAWFSRFQIAGLMLTKFTGEQKAKYLANSPEPRFRERLAQIHKDAIALEKYPVFARDSGGKADAAAFLNPLVSWPNQHGKLELPEAVTSLLTSPSFAKIKPDWKKLNLDFTWLSKLAAFDHWEVDQVGPYYGKGESYRIADAPMLDYLNLSQWAKLRLLAARDQGGLNAAFLEVDQLARLIFTNESLLSSMSAIAILRIENGIYHSLAESVRKTLLWKPIPMVVTDAAKRYFWAQSGMLDVRLSNELFKQFSELQPGLCIRVSESLGQAVGFRRLMRSERPEAYDRLDNLARSTQAKCRPSFIRRMWSNPEYQGLFKPGEDIFQTANDIGSGKDAPALAAHHPRRFYHTTIDDVEKHPEVGLPLGYVLLAISEPNFLRGYEKFETTKEPDDEK